MVGKNVPVFVSKSLAEDIAATAEHFGLSKQELLEQAISIFIDWRSAGLCAPYSEAEKLAMIYKYAQKVFESPTRQSCF